MAETLSGAPSPEELGALALLRSGVVVLALAAGLSSCVPGGSWSRQTIHQRIPHARVAELIPGDDLGRCLEVLGAPLLVRELGDGASALAWGWLDESGYEFRLRSRLGGRAGLAFDFDRLDRRAQGLLLLFDPDQSLVMARRGALRDLLADLPRPRPAFDEGWVEAEG